MGGSERDDDDDDTVCLGESFFINDDYKLTTFTFGSQVLDLLCLQSASTDFDLTGQLVWPGANLMNDYISHHPEILTGCSVIELGSGVGVTGILCSRFCREVILTDHNEEVLKILKRNIELESSEKSNACGGLVAEKLDWGNSGQLSQILEKHQGGFDLVLGADICPQESVLNKPVRNICKPCDVEEVEYTILKISSVKVPSLCLHSFQQNSIPPLFDTVEQLLRGGGGGGEGRCKFILAYVSRAKVMDVMVTSEAKRHGLQMKEIEGTRSVIANLEGVIYEITL